MVGTITDNGSNFVKVFEQYHITNDEEEAINADDIFQVININEEKDTELLENDDMDVDSAEQFTLPKHFRCASHTLNLIATTDYKNLIKENAVLRKRHTAAFQKCNLLWNKANRPKSNEIIQNILGHTLSRPGITRWNSLYDSVKQILKEKVKLNTLFKKLELEPFKGTELLFLEDYCMVMEPLAHTLDFLQGEHANNSFFGFLLPSLLSLINKYEKKVAVRTTYKYGGEYIAKMCLDNLRRRFADILSLNCKEVVIAAVLIPQFKFRWYNIVKYPTYTKEDIKKFIIDAARDLDDSNYDFLSDESDTTNLDQFFDFSDDKVKVQPPILNNDSEMARNSSQSSSVPKSKTSSKIELELLRYLEDKRNNIHIINEYPTLKKIFIKFNTCLPSSGAVERLFSFAGIIDAPRRNGLTDENFEILVLCKANQKKYF
uniref:Uncharacterized protein LOC114347928 n=2 Tax=Diabrotica virgifera virgifera TaxID=50390 RepID=A0A6P7H747_DIAVI